MRTMWKTHRARFILAGTIKFVHDVLQFMSPVILQQLLRHLEDDNTSTISILDSFIMQNCGSQKIIF